MTSVALIGAGDIGKRHLQGLLRLSEPSRIEVYDPSRERVATAVAALGDVPAGAEHEVLPRSSVSELSQHFDVAIIATTASARLDALETLLEQASITHVVLEKFLFQSLPLYDRATELLDRCGVRGWVNTPRRMWPCYQELKSCFAGDPTISCRVSTSMRLAIGTTAVHFLDTLAFVTGCDRFELHGERLVLVPEASRRPGYEEFAGAIYGTAATGGSFEYIAHPQGDAPILIELSSPQRRYLIREPEAQAWYAGRDSGWRWQAIDFAPVMQSRLTHRVVEELAHSGECGLPTFAESAVLHEQILTVLLAGYRRLSGKEVDACPIT